jgi:hypothetical protein
VHCTLVHFGILWRTYEKVNVPTTGDIQQVPRSNLELNRMEEFVWSAQQKLRGWIETVGVTVIIVCKSLYRTVKTACKSMERWPRYKEKTERCIA